jgi:hypothetical protein
VREADHSPLSTVMVKITWNSTFTPHHKLFEYTGTNLTSDYWLLYRQILRRRDRGTGRDLSGLMIDDFIYVCVVSLSQIIMLKTLMRYRSKSRQQH